MLSLSLLAQYMLRDYSDSAESLSSDTESGEGTGGSGRSATAALLAALESSSEKKPDSSSKAAEGGGKKITGDEGNKDEATRSDTTNQISQDQITKNGLCLSTGIIIMNIQYYSSIAFRLENKWWDLHYIFNQQCILLICKLVSSTFFR